MTRTEILTKAAGKLIELAADIKESNTMRGGVWGDGELDQRAKADHDECLTLSTGLLLLAQASA